MSALAQTPLSVRIHHTFKKFRSFFTKKYGRLNLKNSLATCPQNIRTGQTALNADVFYGLPLIVLGQSMLYRFKFSPLYKIIL